MAEKKSTGGKSAKPSNNKSGGKSSTKTNVKRVVKAAQKYDTDKSFAENKEAVAGVVAAAATSAKRASNKKTKKVFIALLIILIIAVIGVCIYGYFQGWFDKLLGGGDDPLNYNSATYNVTSIAGENVSVHFLELGNKYVGDCVYIKAGDADILIDAGSRNDSAPTIIKYINQYVKDNKLEYVIATHAHQDHLAGFYSTEKVTGVFDTFEVDTLIDFPLNAKTGKGETIGKTSVLGRYNAAREKLIENGTTHYTADQCFDETDGAKRVYQITSGVTLEILYNYYYYNYDASSKGNVSNDENNYSVCCMLNDGDEHYLFTGDLEEEGERKMVEYYNNGNDKNLPKLPHCQLYKAGHHGSGTSSCTELLKAITPNYVCICTCAGTSEYTADNDNQFPYQAFVDRIAPFTKCVYATTVVDNYVSSGWGSNGTVKSLNGNIVFGKTDGKVTLYFSNDDKMLKDTDWFKNHRICPKEWQ